MAHRPSTRNSQPFSMINLWGPVREKSRRDAPSSLSRSYSGQERLTLGKARQHSPSHSLQRPSSSTGRSMSMPCFINFERPKNVMFLRLAVGRQSLLLLPPCGCTVPGELHCLPRSAWGDSIRFVPKAQEPLSIPPAMEESHVSQFYRLLKVACAGNAASRYRPVTMTRTASEPSRLHAPDDLHTLHYGAVSAGRICIPANPALKPSHDRKPSSDAPPRNL